MFKAVNWLVSAVAQPTKSREMIFREHWEHLANFYRTESQLEHAESVSQTNIQHHLHALFRYLKEEEIDQEQLFLQSHQSQTQSQTQSPSQAGSSGKKPKKPLGSIQDMKDKDSAMQGVIPQAPPGPCLEFLLQHRLLETLVAWAKGDVPAGMRLLVLQEFPNLLALARRPILAENGVHAPLESLLRAATEIDKDTAYEGTSLGLAITELIYAVMEQLRQCPPLLSIFFVSSSNSVPSKFFILTSLIPYLGLQGKVGDTARKAAAVCAQLTSLDDALAAFVAMTDFCKEIAFGLTQAYCQLPSSIDRTPDWQELSSPAAFSLVTKKELTELPLIEGMDNLLTQTETLDAMLTQAAPTIREALLRHAKSTLFERVLTQALLQPSEKNALAATIYVTEMIKVLREEHLQETFVKFLFGAEPKGPEERPKEGNREEDEGDEGEGSGAGAGAREPGPRNGETDDGDGFVESERDHERIRCLLISRIGSMSEPLSLASLQFFDAILGTFSEHVLWTLVLRNIHTERVARLAGSSTLDLDELKDSVEEILSLAPAIPSEQADSRPSSTNDLSSGDHPEDDHNDYLLDAQETHRTCLFAYLQWSRKAWSPSGAPTGKDNDDDLQAGNEPLTAETWDDFYEGSFLKALFGELSRLLVLPFERVLVVTSIFSKLVHLPDPVLHRFLLSPRVSPPHQQYFLGILRKLMRDAANKAALLPGFRARLERLQAGENPVRNLDRVSSDEFADLILEEENLGAEGEQEADRFVQVFVVLREFLKELAAIILVKSQTATMPELEFMDEVSDAESF